LIDFQKLSFSFTPFHFDTELSAQSCTPRRMCSRSTDKARQVVFPLPFLFCYFSTSRKIQRISAGKYFSISRAKIPATANIQTAPKTNVKTFSKISIASPFLYI
jgi:hypothetical protein